MHRSRFQVSGLLVAFGLLAFWKTEAWACMKLGNDHQIVFLENDRGFGTALMDGEGTLTTVTHVRDELREPPPYRSCFRIRNTFGQDLPSKRFAKNQPQELSWTSRKHQKSRFRCEGFSSFLVSDPFLRKAFAHDIERRLGIIQRLRAVNPRAAPFLPNDLMEYYAETLPFEGSPDWTLIAENWTSTEPEDRGTETSINPVGDGIYAVSSREVSVERRQEHILANCEGWYGFSGSVLLDEESCIVGVADQLDPDLAVYFRHLAPLGKISFSSQAQSIRTVACAP